MQSSGGRLIWWLFFVLGMGTLLPWNFCYTPNSYWNGKLSESNTTEINITNNIAEDNDYEKFWQNSLAFATMATNLLMCAGTSMLMNVVPRNLRIYVPIIGIAICFSIMAAMTQMDTEGSIPEFFWVSLSNVVVMTALCAVFQSSLIGLSAEVGDVMPAVMGGQGAGGVFACLTDIIAKVIVSRISKFTDGVTHDAATNIAAGLYFTIAVVFMFICVGSYKYLQTADGYQERLQKNQEVDVDDKVKFIVTDGEAETAFQAIRRIVWPYHLTVFLTFAVTLSLFPGLLLRYESVNKVDNDYHNDYFNTIWVLLLFNIFDFAGRLASGPLTTPGTKFHIIKKNQPFRLVGLTMARLIFIVLFFKCNIKKTTGTVWFMSDAIFILLVILFSLSNGLCGGIAMVYGPQVAPEHVREQVGGYLCTTILAGLFCGSILGFPVIAFSMIV